MFDRYDPLLRNIEESNDKMLRDREVVNRGGIDIFDNGSVGLHPIHRGIGGSEPQLRHIDLVQRDAFGHISHDAVTRGTEFGLADLLSFGQREGEFDVLRGTERPDVVLIGNDRKRIGFVGRDGILRPTLRHIQIIGFERIEFLTGHVINHTRIGRDLEIREKNLSQIHRIRQHHADSLVGIVDIQRLGSAYIHRRDITDDRFIRYVVFDTPGHRPRNHQNQSAENSAAR